MKLIREFHRPHFRLAATPVCLLTIALAAAAASPACAQVKLGFQAPLTGQAATDGKSAKIAAEMAVEKINAGGGVLGQKMDLIAYDDQAKTEEAVFTANKLVGQDGVKFVHVGELLRFRSRRRPDLPEGRRAFHLRLRRPPRHHAQRQFRFLRRASRASAGASRRQVPR